MKNTARLIIWKKDESGPPAEYIGSETKLYVGRVLQGIAGQKGQIIPIIDFHHPDETKGISFGQVELTENEIELLIKRLKELRDNRGAFIGGMINGRGATTARKSAA